MKIQENGLLQSVLEREDLEEEWKMTEILTPEEEKFFRQMEILAKVEDDLEFRHVLMDDLLAEELERVSPKHSKGIEIYRATYKWFA